MKTLFNCTIQLVYRLSFGTTDNHILYMTDAPKTGETTEEVVTPAVEETEETVKPETETAE